MQRVDIPDEARRDEKTASIQTGIQVQARPGGCWPGRSHQLKRVATTASALRRGRASRPIRVPSRFQTVRRPSGQGMVDSLILGLGLLLVYSANGRELGTDDTLATTLLPLVTRTRGRILARSLRDALARRGSSAAVCCPLARPDHFALPGCSGLADPAADGTADCLPWIRGDRVGTANTVRAMKECRRMAKWSIDRADGAGRGHLPPLPAPVGAASRSSARRAWPRFWARTSGLSRARLSGSTGRRPWR